MNGFLEALGAQGPIRNPEIVVIASAVIWLCLWLLDKRGER